MANIVFDFLHNYETGERREPEPATAYQYDEGHVLEAVLPEVITSAEIHYWIRGMEEADAYTPTSITPNADGSCTVLGNIPNKYFETNGELRIYIVVTDGTASITTYEGKLHIAQRAMPDDYVDDDPENEATRILTEAQAAATTATQQAQAASASAGQAQQSAQTLSQSVEQIETNTADITQLKEDYTTILDSAYATDTVHGEIASFPDGADGVPVKSLTVNVEPVQDLHGYDHPWPGGGNVNKLPPAVSFETITVGNSKITPYPDGHYHLSKTAGSDSDMFTINLASPVTVSTNQYINYISNASSGNMIANLLGDGGIINGGYWGKPSANIASEGIATKWQFYLTAGIAGEFDLWPIISDTPVSEFTPYSNICPISGHTSAVVTRCNRNFLDMENILPNGSYSEDGTVFSLTSSVGDRPTFQFAKEDGSYILTWDSVSGTMTGGRLQFYNANDQLVTTRYFSESVPYTVVGVCKVKFNYGNSGTVIMTKPMLRKSTDSDSTYQAPNTTIYTIDLDGTRYGGSLDVGTGVLTVDRKYRFLNGVNGDGVTYNQNGHTAISTRAFVTISDKAYGVDNAIASSFHFVAAGDIVGMMIGRAGNNGIEFYLDPSVPNTADGVKAWFADNPTDLVYELAEPFTVQLTPQEVTTLKGQNNIWSDAGNVDVTYRADTKLYIQKLTAPTEDDMVADANIVSGQYFMVGNTLYKATANIASGGAITPNVNCTRKSLPEALNEINA